MEPKVLPGLLDGPRMELRDWFAGQTLIALYVTGGDSDSHDKIARRAYAMADSMLAVRERKPNG